MANLKVGASGILKGIAIRSKRPSPNYYGWVYPSKGITIHHMAGTSFDSAGARFEQGSAQASAHYGVGPGYIQQYVGEEHGAWHGGCTFANTKTIGIETLNSTGAPDWKVSDETYDTLVSLVADIAYRHGIYPLKHGKNVFGHREYAELYGAGPTACPGPYLFPRLDDICKKANRLVAWKKGDYSKGLTKTTDALIVRTGPGKNYPRATNKDGSYYTLPKNCRCNIVEVRNGFGKLKNGRGWTNMKWQKPRW